MSSDAGTPAAGGGKHRRRAEAALPDDAGFAAAATDADGVEPDGVERDGVERDGVEREGVEREGVEADADRVPARRKRKQLTFWQELPLLVALAIVLAVIIKMFAFQAFVIPSESMQNTVLVNDRVMTNKLVYLTRDPHRGEVVVFNRTGDWPELTDISEPENTVGKALAKAGKFIGFVPSGTAFIKRVIGLPGDTIACCKDGHMLVNGQPLDESAYVQGINDPASLTGTVTVPEGHIFVMGDNRQHSSDSRFNGTIPIDSVVGRAAVVMWPRQHWKGLRVPASVEDFSAAPAARGMAPTPAVAALAVVTPIAFVRHRRRLRRRRG